MSENNIDYKRTKCIIFGHFLLLNREKIVPTCLTDQSLIGNNIIKKAMDEASKDGVASCDILVLLIYEEWWIHLIPFTFQHLLLASCFVNQFIYNNTIALLILLTQRKR